MKWIIKNLQALDHLVKHHLKLEYFCKNIDLKTAEPEVLMARSLAKMRTLIMTGKLADAVSIARGVAPGVLEDPRMMLKIKIHILKEMTHNAHDVKNGEEYFEKLRKAIEYCRDSLAPFALDAFPEAYNELLNELTLFAFPELSASREKMWSEREDIADVLISTIRATEGSYDSKLAFLVRYLGLVHLHWEVQEAKKHLWQSEMRKERLRHKTGEREEGRSTGQENEEEKNDGGPSVGSERLSSVGSRVVNTLDKMVASNEQSENHSKSSVNDLLARLKISPLSVEKEPLRNLSSRQFEEAEIQSLVHSLNISREDAVNALRYADGNDSRAFRCELSRYKFDRKFLLELVHDYCLARGLNFSSNDDPSRPKDVCGQNNRTWCDLLKNLRLVSEQQGIKQLVKSATELCPYLLEEFPRLAFQISQFNYAERLREGNYEGAIEIARTKLAPLASKDPELLTSMKHSGLLLAYPDMSSSYSSVLSYGHVIMDQMSLYIPENVYKKMKSKNKGQNSKGSDVTGFTSGQDKGRTTTSGERQTDHVKDSVSLKAPEAAMTGDEESLTMDMDSWNKIGLEQDATALSEAIYSAVAKALNVQEPRLLQLLSHLLETHGKWSSQSKKLDNFAIELGVLDLTADYEDEDPSAITGEQKLEDGKKNEREEELDEEKVLTLMAVLSIVRAEAIDLLQQHGGRDADVQEILESKFG